MQVEQKRDPSLADKAVAIQQKGDIIALNNLAKAAGVRKHCAPSEARELLKPVQGKVVQVNRAEDKRVSYQPYRSASKAFFAVLDNLSKQQGLVVEKASIDEAFILLPNSAVPGVAGGA